MKRVLFVVVFAKKVHCFAKFVKIYKRTYKNKRSEDIPFPEITLAEIIVNITVRKSIFYASCNKIIPNGNNDGEGKKGKYVRR